MKKLWNKLGKKEKKPIEYTEETESDANHQKLETNLEANIKNIQETLGYSADIVVRTFKIGSSSGQNAAVIFINGLVDKEHVGNFIIDKVMDDHRELNSSSAGTLFTGMKEQMITVAEVGETQEWNKTIQALVSGKTILLLDGWDQAMICPLKGGATRAISEPSSEQSIRGPQESFIESLHTNVAMVRRRIKSAHLRVESVKIGEITETEVTIMYVKGIANEKILTELKERLRKVEVDELIGSNTIEEWIRDGPRSVWPTIYNTQRPDVVMGELMEGRIAVFVDGTPNTLILPATFIEFFQSAEDYYMHWSIASFLRMLRLVGISSTLLFPSFYIAFLSFHPDLIPTPLLISLAAQRQEVPFPLFIEVLLLELTFEFLREAGLRMPKQVGQAVSIVGALVLGEAAVSAGIVSSATVIIVAATAIASFTMSNHSMIDAVRILRFGMIILASSLGLYGIGLGLIILIAHTSSLRSFGVPYLTPFAPLIFTDLKDTLIRVSKPFMSTRPRLIAQKKVSKVGNTDTLGPAPRDRQTQENHSQRDPNEY
ncbi:spore germination protein [Domibacillus sp. DTU_2020_1001157_1_SI_ALB_TIR_016]|uniref:spore germination protein n=1 Tax=Domibacillus sp. DTU_2020_1001157_1_SI_ALB_TIR_016 TaxID=3077789 RepID=UPI0028E5A697|nr:spore germination protein [Domibacillus sp. DTU_2020_1001157_1_SI_ALB_TIR_016]WNS77924.1 spore germination protein [Domibacillus sp. DTU_2020_1001157_1_SI_ALB_TIR_016]